MNSRMLGEVASFPGIDPRPWISLAIVTETNIDDDGAFCDITLMPDGSTSTARVSAPYAGQEFGQFVMPQKDDEVVVMCPDGQPDAGWIIIGRLYSASDKPPDHAKKNPNDYTIHVKDKDNVYVKTGKGGNVTVEIGDNGNFTAQLSQGKATIGADGQPQLTIDCTGGGIVLVSKGNAKLSLDGAQDTTVASHLLKVGHLAGDGLIPPIATPGPALAGGAVVVLGTDTAFSVSFVPKGGGGGPGPLGLLTTIVFSRPFSSVPYVVLTPMTEIAAKVVPILGLGGSFYVLATPATVQIFTTAVPVLPAPFMLGVHCIG